MGIEALIGSLVADGTAEAERIRQAARDDAAAIVAEATARGEGGIAAARAAAEAELRTQVAEALFKARRDGRRAVLRAFMPALVMIAVAYLPDGPAVARCHPDVAALVREAVRERRGVEVREDESAPPGVVLEDAQGRVRVEETLAVRLTRLWPVLRMQVARRMAPEGV
jgi:vacuolar-type H+-ATPase subunit E/Vma4